MATDLTGLKVQNTYNALLKIGDNSDLTGIAKVVSDGVGHQTVLYLSTSQVGIGGVPDAGVGLHVHGNIKVGNIETTGYLRAPATFTIDPAAHGDDTGVVVIAGDLRVDGTTTTINSTVVSVDDKNIVLGDGATADSDNNGAGITVLRPSLGSTNSFIQWNETTDQWDFSHSLNLSLNTTTDLSEGTNLYYTDTRFDNRLSTKTTDNLTEGLSNLYFTTERARASFSGGTGVTITSGSIAIGQNVGTTDNVTFGSVTGKIYSTNKTSTPDKIGDVKIARVHESGNTAISSFDNLDTFILSNTATTLSTGTKPTGASSALGIISLQTLSGNYYTQLALDTEQNQLWIRSANNALNYGSWETFLNSSNYVGVFDDHYLRSDQADTMTGNLTVVGNVQATTARLTTEGQANLTSTAHGFQIGDGTTTDQLLIDNNTMMVRNNGAGADMFLNSYGGDVFVGVQDANTTLYVTNNLYSVIHSGNIGSQSVNYATTAGSATNADTVDSKHATDFTLDYVTNNGASTTNSLTITSDTFTNIYSATDQNDAGLRFSSLLSRAQYGDLTFNHTDTLSYGSAASFKIGSSEATTTILADGKLMYAEGIYSKPSSGTGAGTRKDQNWDLAYAYKTIGHLPLDGSQEMTGGILPSTNGTLNLGGSSNRWNIGYFNSLRITNVVTNRILKFNGSTIDDSLMTDDGATVTVGGNLAVDTDTLYVHSANNQVGIGTSSPNSTLHVDGDMSIQGAWFWYSGYTSTTGSGVANGTTIEWRDGITDLNTAYMYTVRLTTSGTGTNSGSTYIVNYNPDTTTWEVRAVSLSGTTSNHPLLAESSGVLVAYTNHTTAYPIRWSVETVICSDNDGTFHNMGADFMWQRNVDDLRYDDGKVGIGMDAVEKFEVAGNIKANTANGGGFFINGNSGIVRQGSEMEIHTNGASRLRISDTGVTTFNNNVNITKDNVGIPTNYGIFTIEATDSQIDLVSSSAGTWGSAINFVEGSSTTANTNVWSIARMTSGASNVLNFNFGTANQHDNTTQLALYTNGNANLTGNLGINGASSSAYPLNVTGSINTDTDYRVDGVAVITTTRGGTFADDVTITGRLGVNTTTDTNSRLRINDGGIDVVGTSAIRLRFYNGTTFQSGIQAVQTGGEMISGSVAGDLAIRSQSDMLFATGGNTERLRIDSDGITTLTAEGYQLKIVDESSGNIGEILSGNTTLGFFADRSNSVANSNIMFSIDNSTKMYINDSGYVGINETNQSAWLQIKGSDSANALSITDSGGGAGVRATVHSTQGTYIQLYDGGGTQTIQLDARTDSTNRDCYFNMGGKFGIGTTTPNVKTEIAGTLYAQGGSAWNGGGTEGDKTDAAIIIDEGDYIYTRDSSQYLRKLIGKNGDIIQIGETGTSLIDGTYFYSGTSCLYRWHDNTSVAMHLDGTGLGIFNTVPEYALDIVGGIRLLGEGNDGIRFDGGNANRTLIRVDANGDGSSNGSDYGFSINYVGTRSGNANSLVIYSDNQNAASQIEAFTMYQNGYIGIGQPTPSYRLDVGGDTRISGNLYATADVVAYQSSDRELKNNIKPIENAIDKVNKIGGYTFDWNDKQDTFEGNDVGVIAQEIEEVLPQLVTTRDNGYKAVKYEKLVALLIESVKELSAEVESLKKQIK